MMRVNFALWEEEMTSLSIIDATRKNLSSQEDSLGIVSSSSSGRSDDHDQVEYERHALLRRGLSFALMAFQHSTRSCGHVDAC